MAPTHVYVKRNPIHPYTYNNPDDLPIPHILHVGLDYFVGLAYGLAKDPDEAELIIDKTIERAKDEYKPD